VLGASSSRWTRLREIGRIPLTADEDELSSVIGARKATQLQDELTRSPKKEKGSKKPRATEGAGKMDEKDRESLLPSRGWRL
jgi:hypothetical protein